MILSDEQTIEYDKIMRWKSRKGDKRYVLAGYAGTGKSTIAGEIASQCNNVMFMAYTGKAANVLRDKGCYAETIHSSIYCFSGEHRDDKGRKKPSFRLNHKSPVKDLDLVVVDEYSMLSERLIHDLELIAKKVLYLGDPFQLPPVAGNCVLEPDGLLTEIHRQALDSPILRAATDVRQGKSLSFCDHGDFVYAHKRDTDPEIYLAADQVLVGFNATRRASNDWFRRKLKFNDSQNTNPYPSPGERLICLKNNHNRGLFNGMTGTCAKRRHVSNHVITLDFDNFEELPVYRAIFDGKQIPDLGKDQEVEQFDYGYVITCHKSQGSEWESVLVLNQPVGQTEELRQRWLYTAITRASKRCVLVEP